MIETQIDALGFLAQLDEEIVFDYEATALTITQIITDLLTYQENVIPITLGTIQPAVTRSISVQQDTILGVLRGLRDTVGGYISVDTNRRLNWYTDIGENKGQQIRYKKNIKGLHRTLEYTNFGNRLYCYGAGEGSARIHLSEAIGMTVDYVEDIPSQGTNGICIRQLVDKSITDPDVLLAWANLQLAGMKNPRASYTVDMVNLAAMDWTFEALQLGSIVKVIDEDLGIDISARIVKITRDLSNPENIQVEISNVTRDIIDTMSGVYDNQQFSDHIATRIGAGQVVVLGEFVVSDWLTGGTTNIKGDYIRSGVIQSNNWGVGAGSYFDLVAGTFKLGGSAAPKLSWNGTTLVVSGTIYATAGEFTGTLKVTNVEAGKTLTINGTVSAAGGAVIIDSTALKLYSVAGITNNKLVIYRPSGTYRLFVGWEDNTYAYVYSEKELVCQGNNLLLQGGYVQINSTILRPSTAAYTDLGSATYYFNEINYKTLTDRGCPMPVFKSHTDAIMGIKTRKRKVTIADAKRDGMGSRALERIKKHGTEIEEFDLDRFPEDLLAIPTQDDYDSAEQDYQRRITEAKEKKEDISKVIKYEPKKGYCMNELLYSLVKSHQEIVERISKLEAT
jgi:phage minor structural protein